MKVQFLSLLALLAACPVFAQNNAGDNYDQVAMAEARAALKASHGAQLSSLILGERLEYHSNGGDPLMLWEGQGWLGSDQRKLWIKTEGEYDLDEGELEEAELQMLYSHAISPFWDLQMGLRQDIKPDPSRTYAAIGAQGLAPFWFELDGALFVSDQGDFSSRLEAEYELRLTQRLILQPRIELNVAFSEDEEVGVGSGLSAVDAGLRLRYEIVREIAPYVGVSWSRSFGATRDLQRLAGEDTHTLSFVAGVRFWF